MYYVYILFCSDRKTYVGCTNNLKDRIKRHKNGQVKATRNKLPLKLVSYFALSNKHAAYEFEKYLKTGSGRAFIKKHKLAKR